MKKLLFVILLTITFCFNGWSANEVESDKPLPIKKKGLSKVKNPVYRCFEVTFYLSCGYVWGGDVCVWTESMFITEEQFATAWNFKNIQLCG